MKIFLPTQHFRESDLWKIHRAYLTFPEWILHVTVTLNLLEKFRFQSLEDVLYNVMIILKEISENDSKQYES
jgi:peptidoglycan biosynthesis protein MviN/MurJ (putative lipid II flippase)